MAPQRPVRVLDAAELRENAITSIRLGVEDFERCRHQAGDPARALSAVRNLFAGVLLLFKYKIATCVDDPADAPALIFNPPEIGPRSDGNGGVEWVPTGRFKSSTIDVGTIRKRFEAFGIEVDWDIIDKLQECRNHLEHLHPENTLGEVADFVAELFPVLRDFIQMELDESPTAILGDTWQLMLLHHNFFMNTTEQCEEAWSEAQVPDGMEPWRKKCRCPSCGSTLLTPASEDLDAGKTVEGHDDEFQAVCIECGGKTLIAPLMINELDKAHRCDPRNGEEEHLERCSQCSRLTFLIEDQSCLWCAAELDYYECEVCDERLGQEDQDNGGLCSYHAHSYEKFMRED